MQEQAPSVGNWGFIPLRISRGMYEVHLGVVPSEGEEAGVLTLLLPFIHHGPGLLQGNSVPLWPSLHTGWMYVHGRSGQGNNGMVSAKRTTVNGVSHTGPIGENTVDDHTVFFR